MDILRSVVNSRDIGYKVGQYLVLLPVVVVREMVRQVSLDKVSVLFFCINFPMGCHSFNYAHAN